MKPVYEATIDHQRFTTETNRKIVVLYAVLQSDGRWIPWIWSTSEKAAQKYVNENQSDKSKKMANYLKARGEVYPIGSRVVQAKRIR